MDAEHATAVNLPLIMLLIFGSAKLLEEIFERLRLPGIVGQIIAGIVLGPSLLGWVHLDQFVQHLAELGVMFLLFRVGLEVKASELARVGATATLTAVAGVVVPFFSGWGIAIAWGLPQIEAVFIGAAMVATSVGITAQVLATKGLLHHMASKIILAAAVIDDVLGLLVLAMVSSVAKGQVRVGELVLTAVVAIAFTLIVATWGTRAMRLVVPRGENLRVSEAQFALAMCLLFSLAVLATYAGVAAIIGAFLAGMALSETVSHRVHELAQGVTELLVPFFLVSIGLNLNVAAFRDPSLLVLSLVILLAAVLSKLVGCGLGALSTGRANAIRIGVGMIPRGEVGMVVAQIGLTLGVVSQAAYGVVVFMSIMTTIVAPPLLKLAYRDLITPGQKDYDVATIT